MPLHYSDMKTSTSEAEQIAKNLFNLTGRAIALDGEMDFNFRIETSSKNYLLKVSRPNEVPEFVEFQSCLLQHISKTNSVAELTNEKGDIRYVRLLPWVEGRLWSCVNPITTSLLFSLGEKAGQLTAALHDFKHPFADRYLEWDISNALWCKEKLQMFNGERKALLSSLLHAFEQMQSTYTLLRKSIVHNDVNDNNIVVDNELIHPCVTSIIDFGDAVQTQTINDLAITISYAMMHQEDPLAAAVEVIRGYHNEFPLLEEELSVLHTLISMRLTITVTKSAMNKISEPENEYHQISEQPAWDVLKKWHAIHPDLATCHFRKACGFDAHQNLSSFKAFCSTNNCNLRELFPTIQFEHIEQIDMSVGSYWLGHEFEYTNSELSRYKFAQLYKNAPTTLFAGGYLESRPFYSTPAYQVEGMCGPEHRTVHLGIDFWVQEQTPIHAFTSGKVYSVHDNAIDKDYGPTVILKHELVNGACFFSLYGHLAKDCLTNLQKGDIVNAGALIGHVGTSAENGGWVPHLHFQLMLSMLDNDSNFPGVATPNSIQVWKDICPSPSLLFNEINPTASNTSQEELLTFRKQHLGRSLSVSYEQPLTIVRGSGVHLIDPTGRKYLDTVNNVAHVGHEHPRIVQVGSKQMGLLNTNTRYVHETINNFTKQLLATLPEELSVVHYVNSGSEANELAMRMCRAATQQKDMIAVEMGYHGNTQACIDVSSYKYDSRGGTGVPEHTHIVPLPDMFRGLYRGMEKSHQYASHIQEQINTIQARGRNISGFICESIISCAGQIELPENYLQTAYDSVRKEGGLCIADEIQVGIGRVGTHFWGFQLHGVIPDIVTIGKPLGNGHPLAAVVCTQSVADAFANGMEYFNTFGGNPVSCAIGQEVLRVVQDEQLQENAEQVGAYFKTALQEISSRFPIVQDVRGQGLFLGFEFVDSQLNPLPQQAAYVVNRMKAYGILVSIDGKDHNAIKIKPPLVFSHTHVDEFITRLAMVLHEDFIVS